MNLNHENIINMKEFSEDAVWEKSSGNIPIDYIVLEHISEGELLYFINTGGPFNEEICRYYFR